MSLKKKKLTSLDYPNSSRKRILDFHLATAKLEGPQRQISIDGAGPITRPLCIKVLELKTGELELNDRARVLGTVEPEHRVSEDAQFLSEIVKVLKPGFLSSADLENWVIDYTYHYSKEKLPHATGFVFGVEYARKGLPHVSQDTSRLVSSI